MADAAPGRRERKKAESRQALQDAALRLATEVGYENLTVEAIAEAADVSPRTFFNYFSSKDEALLAPNPEVAQTIRDVILARPAAESPLEAVRGAIHEIGTRLADRQHVWQARVALVEQHPQLRARMVSNFTFTEQHVTAAVAARLGTGPDEPYPQLVGAAATATLRIALQHWRPGDARPLAELVDDLLDHLAAGLPVPSP